MVTAAASSRHPPHGGILSHSLRSSARVQRTPHLHVRYLSRPFLVQPPCPAGPPAPAHPARPPAVGLARRALRAVSRPDRPGAVHLRPLGAAAAGRPTFDRRREPV